MERICYLVGACPCEKPEGIREGDLVIAVDGGYEQAMQWKLKVDYAVGDFDSLGYVPAHERVIRHPVMKDDTDMMLAIRLGLEAGCRRFMLYGGVGGRLDHTLANVQTLTYLATHGAQGILTGEGASMTVFSSGTLRFEKSAQGIVSVFSLCTETRGVTLQGMLYPLEDARLKNDFPLGVSNEFTGEEARVTAGEGMLLVIWQGKPDWLAGWR